MNTPDASMIDRLGAPLADTSFAVMHHALGGMRLLGVDIMHTARSFATYRRMFYRNHAGAAVLASLEGKRVVDLACGYTPCAPDSMFQACRAAGIEFYGVDPVLAEPLGPGVGDRLLARWTGGSGEFLSDPPGLERALDSTAESLPFADASVDEMLCGFLLWVWLRDERVLADVFHEAARVLKPGGCFKLFPLPRWRWLRPRDPGLVDALECFDVSQRFVPGHRRSRTLSAMSTTLVRR